MVRFKAYVNYTTARDYNGFNSYMVRFKADRLPYVFGRNPVSIPIWFDLKTTGAQFRALFIKGFNSYMVRFKEQSVMES